MKQQIRTTSEGYVEVPFTESVKKEYESLCAKARVLANPRSNQGNLRKALNIKAKAAILCSLRAVKNHPSQFFIEYCGVVTQVVSRSSKVFPYPERQCTLTLSPKQKERPELLLWAFVAEDGGSVWIVGGISLVDWLSRSKPTETPRERVLSVEDLYTAGQLEQFYSKELTLDFGSPEQEYEEDEEVEHGEFEMQTDSEKAAGGQDVGSEPSALLERGYLCPQEAIERLAAMGIKTCTAQHMKKLFEAGVIEGRYRSENGALWQVKLSSLVLWADGRDRRKGLVQSKPVQMVELPEGVDSYDSLMTFESLEDHLEVSSSTIRAFVRNGTFKAYRRGRETRFYLPEVDAGLKLHTERLLAQRRKERETERLLAQRRKERENQFDH